MKRLFFTLLLSLIGPATSFAADKDALPKLYWPIECDVGEECWIVNYVDTDPSQAAKDFTCDEKTYDAHKGTDFAVRSMAEIEKGVNVRAALTGVVMRVRDGEDDSFKDKASIQAIMDQKKDCGNGVLIDHAHAGYPGLRTMYCHLKKGSIVVKSKDVVTPGQTIAQVGRSGNAEFPHLHFGITWENDVIDPFTRQSAQDGCGKRPDSLWHDDIAYRPVTLYDSGFSTQAPDFFAIEEGKIIPQDALEETDKSLVYWIALYGVRVGDVINMMIKDPAGKIFRQRTITQEKSMARQYYYTGRRLSDQKLTPGTYRAYTTISRNNEIILKSENDVSVY